MSKDHVSDAMEAPQEVLSDSAALDGGEDSATPQTKAEPTQAAPQNASGDALPAGATLQDGAALPDSDSKKKWYIVHTYSNFEKKVVQALHERIAVAGLAEQFGEMLIPSEQVVDVRRGQKVNVERKFFPGYILVHMEMTDRAHHLVKSTPKVTGFLGSGVRPSVVPAQQVESILQKVVEGPDAPKPSVLFGVGEQVRVCDGPFASFSGFVEDVNEERARLKVSVSIFGRATPVELGYSQVEKI